MINEWRLDWQTGKAYRIDSGQYVFFRNFNPGDFESGIDVWAWLEKEWGESHE